MSRRNAALDRSLEQNIQELLDLHERFCQMNHREMGALARCIFPWWDHQGTGKYAVIDNWGHVIGFRTRAEAEAHRAQAEAELPVGWPDAYVVIDVWHGRILEPGTAERAAGRNPGERDHMAATTTGLPGV